MPGAHSSTANQSIQPLSPYAHKHSLRSRACTLSSIVPVYFQPGLFKQNYALKRYEMPSFAYAHLIPVFYTSQNINFLDHTNNDGCGNEVNNLDSVRQYCHIGYDTRDWDVIVGDTIRVCSAIHKVRVRLGQDSPATRSASFR